MNDICHPASSLAKILKVVLVFSFLLSSTLFVSAQNQEDEQRVINTIPKHIPLKIEILDSGTDSRFEQIKIKLTNTGKKPIYNMILSLMLGDDIKTEDGFELGLTTFHYGNPKLSDFRNVAAEDDICIKKGESVIFDIPKGQAQATENYLQKRKMKINPKLSLRLKLMSFGDKTGFVGSTGGPYPDTKKRSQFSINLSDLSEGFFLTF